MSAIAEEVNKLNEQLEASKVNEMKTNVPIHAAATSTSIPAIIHAYQATLISENSGLGTMINQSAIQQKQNGIIQISDTHYIGSRAHEKDLSFVMIRLNDENYKLWQAFVKGQSTKCLEIWDEITKNNTVRYDKHPKHTQKFLSFINVTRSSGASIKAGLMAFEESLKNYKNFHSEIWIVCALSGNVDPSKPLTEATFPHIEMALTVLTAPKAPFTVHLGIARTVYHAEMAFKKELPTHPSLAFSLHGFAAEAIRLYDPKKTWMWTYPTFNMADIFTKSLPKEIYFTGKEEISKIFKRDEQGGLSIFDEKGNLISQISKEQLETNEFGFLHHFHFGPPLSPFAFTLEALGKLFNQELEVSSRNASLLK